MKTAEDILKPYLGKNIKGKYLCKKEDALKAMVIKPLKKMKEVELAQRFIEYLSDYDLYFEVPPKNVDIVAKSAGIVTAFEIKTSLNFKVLEQVRSNALRYHYSYACVPSVRNYHFQAEICSHFGIGLLMFNPILDKVIEVVKPRLNRKVWADVLNPPEYCKRSIAGTPSSAGTTVTAFRNTIDQIVRYLARHNGATIKDVYDSVTLHYNSLSSTKSCLSKWIDNGVITEFYIDKGRLYLTFNT